jgi:hypothetical protein
VVARSLNQRVRPFWLLHLARWWDSLRTSGRTHGSGSLRTTNPRRTLGSAGHAIRTGGTPHGRFGAAQERSRRAPCPAAGSGGGTPHSDLGPRRRRRSHRRANRGREGGGLCVVRIGDGRGQNHRYGKLPHEGDSLPSQSPLVLNGCRNSRFGQTSPSRRHPPPGRSSKSRHLLAWAHNGCSGAGRSELREALFVQRNVRVVAYLCARWPSASPLGVAGCSSPSVSPAISTTLTAIAAQHRQGGHHAPHHSHQGNLVDN